jgi:hypothetical protein
LSRFQRFLEVLFGPRCPVCGYRVRKGIVYDARLAHKNCALAKAGVEEYHLGKRSP